MPFVLPELPFGKNELEPAMSANTLSYHHGKHHQAYVDNLNKLVEGSSLAAMSLEDVIKAVVGDSAKAGIFNNGAQVWNHTFFWNCMKPSGGGLPSGAIAGLLNKNFGSYESFAQQFTQAGVTQFGSGWAWLVLIDDKLEVMKTSNADTPIAHGIKPLLTVDVWEHAYYLDYQNRRADFISAFLEKLVNWDFVNANLG